MPKLFGWTSRGVLLKTHRSFGLFFLSLLALLFVAGPAGAQDKKAEAQLRTVHGSVVDAKENPVPSGVIYLVNTKTQAVKTYIADDAGNYRFSGLDPNVDYEIHAEHDDLISATRTVSSFNSSRDIEVVLKLSRKKKPA
jgi:Carboxypeptidase regulatory-like domain